jgi:hypothetical protein
VVEPAGIAITNSRTVIPAEAGTQRNGGAAYLIYPVRPEFVEG